MGTGEGRKSRRSVPPVRRWGALGMLAFAAIFWSLVEISIAGAFAGASVAWLIISVAAWFARRKMRIVRQAGARRKESGGAMSPGPFG
jgi:uncharacterized membrane protein